MRGFTLDRYQHDDATRVHDLLARIFGLDSRSREYVRLSTQETYVVRDQGMAVGVGSVWDNPMHPHSRRFGVAVHPEHRGRGYGSRLLAAIDEVKGPRLPLIASLWETQLSGRRFLEARGFRELRRTFTVCLDLAEASRAGYRDLTTLGPAGYSLATLAAAGPAERQEIAALCRDIYARTHLGNPPAGLEFGRWMELSFPDDLMEDGSFTLRHGGSIVAVGLLHRGIVAGRLEFGWRGVAAHHCEPDEDLMMEIATRQIAFAVEVGAREILLECDSTDPFSLPLIDAFPFAPAPTWITYWRDTPRVGVDSGHPF